MATKHESLWLRTTEESKYPQLSENLHTDVVIIGGGITGITAAYLLKNAGKNVILIEQGRLLSGDTGKTTSHTTEVIDTRYHSIISAFGLEAAKVAAESSRASIELIASLVSDLKIDCGFERVPAYLYAEQKSELRELRKEYKAVHQVGLDATLTDQVPLPFKTLQAIRFENQAQFHPARYLLALAQNIPGQGSHVFENSHVLEIQDGDPCVIQTQNGSIFAQSVIVATHSPVFNRFSIHPKIANYRTYVVAAKLGVNSGTANIPKGLYWDLAEPYHYNRTQVIDEDTYLIIGGEDHKTGMESNALKHFGLLEAYTQEHFNISKLDFRWSGQIVTPIDGLPFIGRSPAARNVYISTGYSGNGMTFGTIGAMLLSDLIATGQSRWEGTYRANRIKPFAAPYEFINENKDFPICLVKDRVSHPDTKSLADVKPGEGKIVGMKNGSRLAIYRSESDTVHAVSPTCTHLGCYVHWNNAERSWDCPCHGSRFGIDGDVLNGPAIKNLKKVEINEKGEVAVSIDEGGKKKTRAA